MVQVGIDPGVTGAVAVLYVNTRKVEFFDTPTVVVKSGKKFKSQMDGPAIVAILSALKESTSSGLLVTIEKVNAMPGRKNDPKNPGQTIEAPMGVTSAFNFGFGFGMWIGILSALKIPFQQVHPVTWKKLMLADAGKEKDASRIKAIQLFPHIFNDLKLKKHHGRADALLMAAWSARTNSHVVERPAEETREPLLFS